VSLLLLATSDVSGQPRRQVRASLAELLTRFSNVLARRQVEQTARG
jgi:hypothetical protein